MVFYDPFDPEVQRDPYPFYERLREEAPIYQVPGRGYWVLSRYEDVREAYRSHEALSSARGNACEPGWQPGLIGKDPPKHTRLRRIVQSVFTRQAIETRWAPRVAEICEQLVGEASGAGAFDAFRSLTEPLPVRVITELLGIPDGDLAEFKRWTDHMVAGVSMHMDEEVARRTETAFLSLSRYFWEKVEERRGSGRDDLVTLITRAEEDDRLSTKEAVEFCILLLVAGNETTTNLLGNALVALCERPEEEAKLRKDPSLLPGAIEEMFRFGQPSHCFFRQSTRELSYHGVTIPEGSRFLLSIASGNRDRRAFEEPERFLVDRRPRNDHLAFGSGIHFCLGSMLARLEARTFFTTLLARTRAMRLAGEITMLMNPIVRGPTVLPLELSPA